MHRKYSILLIFITFPLFMVARETRDTLHRNEFGINLFAAQYSSFSYRNRFVLPGIFYRRHYGPNVIRASVEVRQKFYSTGPKEVNQYSVQSATLVRNDSSHWKKNYYDVRIGYARVFGKLPRLKPYVFSELGVQITRHDGWTMHIVPPVDTVPQPEHYRKVDIGLTLGAGVKWEFMKRWTVCLETDFFGSVSRLKFRDENQARKAHVDLDFNHIRTLGISWRF